MNNPKIIKEQNLLIIEDFKVEEKNGKLIFSSKKTKKPSINKEYAEILVRWLAWK